MVPSIFENKMKRKIVCLTPVKNEAWILKFFLKSAEKWADQIIIADQGSTDGSIEIAQSHPKVKLIHNSSKIFNEPERQKLLINEARKYGKNNILIALDADEALSHNYKQSTEWQKLLDAPVGTTIKFRWVNLLPNYKKYWSPKTYHPWCFIDDGTPHLGKKIHSTRVPTGNSEIKLNEIKVLHFQYIDWQRMQSKQRWYMTWERLYNQANSAIKLHRTYSHMYSFKNNNVKLIQDEWLDFSSLDQIQISDDKTIFWWDNDILDMLEKHGVKKFSCVPIWNYSWEKLAIDKKLPNPGYYKDPRNRLQKYIQKWLQTTQDSSHPKLIKLMDLTLRSLGF